MPLCHRLGGFFIEPAAIQRPDNPNLRSAPVGRDDGLQHDGALDLLPQRLAGITRPDLFDQNRRSHIPAGAIDTAARATAGSRPESRSAPSTNARADSIANTAS